VAADDIPLEIRQARLEDWPAIEAFLRDCYGASAPFKAGPRWRWQFVDTPYPPPGDTPVAVWIALQGGQVVGQLAVQPGRMFLQGEPWPAGWIVDVMVRPEFRGQGLGHRIHDVIVASGVTLVTLTMALATRRIAERAGAITLGPVLQMVRPGRLSGSTIDHILRRSVERRSGILRAAGLTFLNSRIGPAAAAATLSAAGALVRSRSPSPHAFDVRSVSSPDLAEIDGLFQACVAECPALFDRARPFLEWRFQRAPDLAYRWIEARRGDGQLAASALWRLPDPVELPVGTVVDVVAGPKDQPAMEAVIEAAVSNMAKSTEAIIAGASDPLHIAAFRRHGFRTVKVHRPTVVTRDARLAARIAALPGPWRLTKADHDWDQIHPAED